MWKNSDVIVKNIQNIVRQTKNIKSAKWSSDGINDTIQSILNPILMENKRSFYRFYTIENAENRLIAYIFERKLLNSKLKHRK